jgi:hypothetical protein
MRPKNVVLLEIMIIFISFKDADLLHYLLPDVFTRWRRVWGTMEAVARPQPPHRCLLVSFVRPEVAYFNSHPPQLTLLKVMAHGATNEKLWRERNVCCF